MFLGIRKPAMTVGTTSYNRGMKRALALAIVPLLAVSLTACGGTKAAEEQKPEVQSAPTEQSASGSFYTEDEAIGMMDSAVSGDTPALSEWQSTANAICAILDSENGNPIRTASTLAAAGSITGTDPETYTLRWDGVDGDGLWMIMFGSTQLACPQWGESVGTISDSDMLVLNAAVEQLSKK